MASVVSLFDMWKYTLQNGHIRMVGEGVHPHGEMMVVVGSTMKMRKSFEENKVWQL